MKNHIITIILFFILVSVFTSIVGAEYVSLHLVPCYIGYFILMQVLDVMVNRILRQE